MKYSSVFRLSLLALLLAATAGAAAYWIGRLLSAERASLTIDWLNIMGLATSYSAILSALIFNAIIIPCLIPLAMKGVKYRPMSSGKMLGRNMMIYGLGGIIAPFVGIKIIDLIIAPVLAALGFGM